MKFVCGLTAVAVIIVTVVAPAAAGDDQHTSQTRPHKAQASSRATPYRHLEPYRSQGFKGAYPGDCAYMQAYGHCMIDLGYGRCEPCDMGMNR